MQDCTTYIGLDVHKNTIWAAAALPDGPVIEIGEMENSSVAVSRLVRRLAKNHTKLCFVYEAGPCGYDLFRQLTAMGHACLVVAPSLIPRRPGDRIKTDRRDAMALGRLARSGDLTAVWVPDPHHEAIRELVRHRADVKTGERRCRQRISAMLLRHSLRWDRDNWTKIHRVWLKSQRFEQTESQWIFEDHLASLTEAEERLANLERQMLEALGSWSLRPVVEGLMAMRGVALVTAMTLAAELGDVTRFDRASELMSFVGLVPREYSSGLTRRQGAITKSGNGHVRRILVESAWAYQYRPSVSKTLRARGARASELVRGIAWKAQKRLCGRYHRMAARNKKKQVAITAVAREMLGFIWAIALQVREEQRAMA